MTGLHDDGRDQMETHKGPTSGRKRVTHGVARRTGRTTPRERAVENLLDNPDETPRADQRERRTAHRPRR